ncbi:MAG: nucleoside recognition domain-containing protein, partial [Romboutsia sp.]|uniref:nucleoside recognition domain-containing protein n=1 Tax=Romboutsia sp. TaxID=1965302 RepID=UPI003F2B96E8
SGYTENLNDSFLAYAGRLIAPIFAPLGFGDWRASVAILSGLGAKEIVVNTMNVLYGNLDTVLPTVFTGVSAYGFLVFSALYTPCIAALATMKKEYGNKMMFISLGYQFALAWVAAFIVKVVGNAIFIPTSSSSVVELLVGGVIIVISIVFILKKLTSKQTSPGCSGCSGCPSQGTCSVEVTSENTN